MRKCIIIFFSVWISGCVQFQWTKDSGTDQEADQDNYACMQEAQQRVSSASVGTYGGSAQSQVITNDSLYRACMRARGYRLEQRTQ
jgi:hypothetical protein